MLRVNLFICLLIFFSKPAAQPANLNFQINGSGLSRDIGIRGNTPPLSWEKNFPLPDKDANGIYEAEITFPTLPTGTVAEYKFIQDNKNWESAENREFITGINPISPAIANLNNPTPLSPSDFSKISAEDMQKDYAIAKKAYMELHPGLYRYASLESIETAFNSYVTFFKQLRTYVEAYL